MKEELVNKESIGKNREIFTITLGKSFEPNTLLVDHNVQRQLLVVSEPKHVYHEWYHKLLNKITFGQRFCERWEHEVESVPVKLNSGLLK